MDSPFDYLIVFLEKKVRTDDKSKYLLKVLMQLKLLRVTFIEMHKYDICHHMDWKDNTDVQRADDSAIKASLDYMQFINILNQLGRILQKESLSMPNLYRIRFYRNKVSEHWDDYSEYSATAGGLNQKFEETAIPSIYVTHRCKERLIIKAKIDQILTQFNLVLEIDDPQVANIADREYEKIYAVLENIDSKLTSGKQEVIPKELVALLFKFGFPAPIQNVRDYSNELVLFIEDKLLKLRNI